MPYSHIIIMGDSLSDRGAMKQTRPIVAKLAGLDRSPLGRFTDDEVWGDLLARKAIQKTIEENIRGLREDVDYLQELLDSGNIPYKERKPLLKQLKEKRKQLKIQRKHEADISHHKKIKYKGQQFLRSYAEGGLTAAEWGVLETKHVPSMGARAMVSTLSQKVESLFEDDRKKNVKDSQKKTTLVIEWSGANDLATVTQNPTEETVRRAVAARIANAKRLIENGYTNIVLFNLPGLENSPRYQGMDRQTRLKVAALSDLFNKTLESELEKLKNTTKVEVNVQIFDANMLAKNAKEEQLGLTDDDEAMAMALVEDFLNAYNENAKIRFSIKDISQLPVKLKMDLNMFYDMERLSENEPHYHAKVLAIIAQHVQKNPKGVAAQMFKELGYDKLDHHVMEVAKSDYYRHGGDRQQIARKQLSKEGLNFYDDVHPTSPLHEKLAESFWSKFGDEIDITRMEMPAEALFHEIADQYKEMIRQKMAGKTYDSKRSFTDLVNDDSDFFKRLQNVSNPQLLDYQEMLTQIMVRAQKPEGKLIHEALKRLEYDKSIVHPDLVAARREANRRLLSVDPKHAYSKAKYGESHKVSLDSLMEHAASDIKQYWEKKMEKERASLGSLLSKKKATDDPITFKGKKRQKQKRDILGLLESMRENKHELSDHERAIEICAQLELIKKEIKSEFNLKSSTLYALCDQYSRSIKNQAGLDDQEIKERVVYKKSAQKGGRRFNSP